MKQLCAALVALSAGAVACSVAPINPRSPSAARSSNAASLVRVAAPLVSDVSSPLSEMVRHAPPFPVVSEREEEEESGGGGRAIVRRPKLLPIPSLHTRLDQAASSRLPEKRRCDRCSCFTRAVRFW